MLFPSCQTVKLKWVDELVLVLSFILFTTGSKRELVERWTSSPLAFQGWQSFFSIMIFICLLIHPRIRNEVKILNRTSLAVTLPVCVCHAIAVAAESAALSTLAVSVFIAWTNMCPAVLAFVVRKSRAPKSSIILGSITVILSVIIIFIIDFTETSRLFYLFLLIHVIVNVFQFLYLKRVKLQIPDFTLAFYNNVTSFITLFPMSVYNATQNHPGFGSIFPCLFMGFISLAVQIFTFRIRSKNRNFLMVLGIAQILTILGSCYMFENTLSVWVWCMVGINCFTTTFILYSYEDDVNKNNQFILVVPQVTKNLYVEKYINYGDIA